MAFFVVVFMLAYASFACSTVLILFSFVVMLFTHCNNNVITFNVIISHTHHMFDLMRSHNMLFVICCVVLHIYIISYACVHVNM
jgi:hypothetical protein